MIRKILIEGVRTHERTEIELGRLTCLVGPNGSGKTTALLAFQSRSINSWLRAGAKHWAISFEGDHGQKKLAARLSEKRALRSTSGLPAVFPYRFDSEMLRARSDVFAGPPKMEWDGKQLAAVLAAWKLSDQAGFEKIVDQLKQVVPNLDNLRPSFALGDIPGFELLFDFRSALGIPASAVSEGTLFALGILAAMREVGNKDLAESSRVLLLDDIDRGLHPDAQVELVKMLRKIAVNKDLQIVMTTHSPFVVDALSPEEVYVFALDDTGTTRARRLSEIPGVEKYHGMLSTGQLWSSHGESWVLEEQAKSKVS